ncbi:MAG: glycosyltransferase family 2 protein [Patescibacteria group bacterium]|nr:glycosyltransferase family 2 protein [Patescibacteria group bacterium]
MKFSVVIPAYNEAESIAAAVKALLAQTVAKNDFEIIVVDNNSKDDTAKIAAIAGADLVIGEKKQGSNLARQAGLDKARGEIIAFLDADSIPPPNWLEMIGQDLATPDFVAVSGPYDYGFTGLKKFLDSIYTRRLMPKAPALLEMIFRKKCGVIIGGNFAARRAALDAIGGLPALDYWQGDDAAIAIMVSRRAGPILFDTKLIIKSSPRRFAKVGFLRLAARYMVTYLKIFFDKKYS